MTQIVNQPFYQEFLQHCASSKRTIRLCAPYVKKSVIDNILRVKNSNVSLELVTKISLESFHRHSSDIGAIANLIAAKYPVYNYSALHAKIYIFDSSACYITSANLTTNGLQRNFEYGIYSDEMRLVQRCITDFEKLCSDCLTGVVTKDNAEQISAILTALPKRDHLVYPEIELYSQAQNFSGEKSAVLQTLTGWKLAVFEVLDKLSAAEFDTTTVNAIAGQLQNRFPNNKNREAKIRQILQFLRDIGLVQFVSPGHYVRLWE